MSGFEIRPRFKRRSQRTKTDILAAFGEQLKGAPGNVRGYIVDHHIYLGICEEEKHFWSPQLSVELLDDDEGLEINALFGPSPQVWLMYIFVYAFLGFLAFVVLIVGGSRWNLGMSAGILWFIPVLAALTILAIITAKTGQKLGHDQMHELYDFFNDVVGQPDSSPRV